MKNRQSAKERGLHKDIDRERHARIDAEIRLHAAAVFVSSDAAAIAYQTIGQYRDALMKLLTVRAPQVVLPSVGEAGCENEVPTSPERKA